MVRVDYPDNIFGLNSRPSSGTWDERVLYFVDYVCSNITPYYIASIVYVYVRRNDGRILDRDL
jgi:hypothetical protein